MNNDIRYIELAKACGVYGTDHLGDLLEFAYSVAADEREACAKVCDEYAQSKRFDGYYIEGFADGADVCANAIRERGEK
jgi:hypothetical protein